MINKKRSTGKAKAHEWCIKGKKMQDIKKKRREKQKIQVKRK
jgi:hypothetical protein